jgi:hypothetical protein
MDLLGLLKFESSLEIEVIEKIIGFLSNFFNLKLWGLTKELEAMWCNPIIRPDDKPLLH